MMRWLSTEQQTQHWQALLESAGEGIWGLDLEGNCTFVNRMAQEILGFSADEMLGHNMHALVHHHYPDGRVYPAEQCSIYEVFRRSTPFRRKHDTMFRKGGESFLAEVSAHPVVAETAVSGVVVTFRDVTESHQQQKDLQEAYRTAARRTAELEAVIESMPQGVYVASRDRSEVRSNQRARDLIGESFPEDMDTLEQALRGISTNHTVERGGRWLRSAGAPIRLNGELIGGVVVATDVTQMRLQDEAMRKSEKLAAVGQLASSIAHEINNPLEAITNLLYLIRQTRDMDEVQMYTASAQEELARVSEITLQTLRFHRTQTQPVWVDLAELARAVMSLYTGRLLVRNVTLDWKARQAPRVLCLEGEMRQVLNNFIRNALDAMSDGGSLSVRVNRQRSQRTGKPGVRLTVADTGEGVSAGMMDRLFEPFQTTKDKTGTGLGLWVSRGIVEKHGGSIAWRTRRGSGHGTLFSMWLPEEPKMFGGAVGDGSGEPTLADPEMD